MLIIYIKLNQLAEFNKRGHTNRSTMQQKLYPIFFYHKKLELLEITENKLQKPRPKLKKYLCLRSNASGNFLQKFIKFVEKRLKISHFKGSIIP